MGRPAIARATVEALEPGLTYERYDAVVSDCSYSVRTPPDRFTARMP